MSASDPVSVDAFPRVAYVSQVQPQTVHAGCIVMHRLFAGYPADRLVVIGPEPSPGAELLPCRYERMRLPLERLNFTRFSGLVFSLRTMGMVPGLSVKRASRLLRGFQPDVIVTLMQVEPWYRLAHRLATLRRVPLVMIVHDLPELFERVYPWALRTQRERDRRVYQAAARRMCVSPAMRDHFQRVFGVGGDVLYPSRSEELRPRPFELSRRLRREGVLTVGFAGTRAYGYGDQLARMVGAFRAAGARLRIYQNPPHGPDPLAAAADIVTFAGFASTPMQTWARVQTECDAVILPYLWTTNFIDRLYRVHFPSKLTEYTALGMPMILVGPPHATGVEWGARHRGAAVVLSQNEPAVWEDALRRLRDSADWRESLARASWDAGQEFDPGQIRRFFIEHLRGAVCEGRERQT